MYVHEATPDPSRTPSPSTRPSPGPVYGERGLCRPEPGAGYSVSPTAPAPHPGIPRNATTGLLEGWCAIVGPCPDAGAIYRCPGNPATRRHASSAAALLHAANAFEARRSGWRCGPWDWTLEGALVT